MTSSGNTERFSGKGTTVFVSQEVLTEDPDVPFSVYRLYYLCYIYFTLKVFSFKGGGGAESNLIYSDFVDFQIVNICIKFSLIPRPSRLLVTTLSLRECMVTSDLDSLRIRP